MVSPQEQYAIYRYRESRHYAVAYSSPALCLGSALAWAQSAAPTKAAAYYLPVEARDLVEWLRRYVPAGAEVPTRSEVVAVAIRIAAEVVSRVTGENLPG